MALRAIVSNTNLRAVVDTDSLEPVNAFKQFRAILSTSNVKAIVDYSYLQPITVFSNLKILANYVNLNYGIDFLNFFSALISKSITWWAFFLCLLIFICKSSVQKYLI